MTEAIFWKAVTENDRRFDGVFFTCVLTTKIFCRPSCPARTPKRENVIFVSDTNTAVQKGFRACLRCKPTATRTVDEKAESAVRICRLIESTGSADLKELGAAAGLSPAYVQRLFKEIVGVSPHKYAEFLKIEKFKSGVQDGKDVTFAMYDAGYESSSRLYEKANKKMGMTPGAYKKGGLNMTINYSVSECELGLILVAASPKGICSVKIGDTKAELVDELTTEYNNAKIVSDPALIKHFVDAILDTLDGSGKAHELPLDLEATSFQMRVWEELTKIPFGETITYAELAKRIGNEKSVRAVASACARNRIAIVIPCHRVIGSDGDLRGYRWGVERKKKILQMENPERNPERSLFT